MKIYGRRDRLGVGSQKLLQKCLIVQGMRPAKPVYRYYFLFRY